MADTAYNVDLNHEEMIETAISFIENGMEYRYVCNAEDCDAYMYPRKGRNKAFAAGSKHKHKEGCPYATYSKIYNSRLPVLVDWLEELLNSNELPTEKAENINKGIKTVSKKNNKLSKTAHAMYLKQASLEILDFLDETNTTQVKDFCISARTRNFFNHKIPEKYYLIIGKIKYLTFLGNNIQNPYAIIHIKTKDLPFEHVLKYKIWIGESLLRQIYEDCKNKYGNMRIKDKNICFIAYLHNKKTSTPACKETSWITHYEGKVTSNRCYFLL